MTALRRTRDVEMARIAWHDLAGLADLDATLADVSLLAECLIDAALRLRRRELWSRGSDGRATRLAASCRCSCSAWASSAASS